MKYDRKQAKKLDKDKKCCFLLGGIFPFFAFFLRS